jgi:hypothetical protein
MTVLSLKMIHAHDGRQEPFDGTCTDRQIKDISFGKLLGIELVARTRDGELLEISKEMFVLLARAHNDKAAVQALEAVEQFTLMPGTRENEGVFFEWLNSVYWNLPLYHANNDEDRNCNSGFWITHNLPETKKWVTNYVAGIWEGWEDELGLKAFTFLCDCFDARNFAKHAPNIAAALKEVSDRYSRIYGPSGFWGLKYPKEETDHVLAAMKSQLPKKADMIAAWIRRVRDMKAPEEIQKLFSHAYVNAGGDVLSVSV